MKLIETSLIVAGGAAAAGVVVYAGVKFYKNYVRKKAEKTAQEKARSEFATAATAFSGLYEPLYLMGKVSLKFRIGVIGDWVTRTANLTDAVNYQDMWKSRLSNYSSWSHEEGLAKINELLSFIFNAGVCRDTAVQITVDGATYKKYSTSVDEMIEADNPARVKTPYWFIEDKILEKGVIEKM
jgi:hypothetical protein